MFFMAFGWFFMVFTFLTIPLSTGSPQHEQDSWFFMAFGWFLMVFTFLTNLLSTRTQQDEQPSWFLVVFSSFSYFSCFLVGFHTFMVSGWFSCFSCLSVVFFMVFTFLTNPLSTGSPKHGQDSWFFMVFGWFTCFSWLLVGFHFLDKPFADRCSTTWTGPNPKLLKHSGAGDWTKMNWQPELTTFCPRLFQQQKIQRYELTTTKKYFWCTFDLILWLYVFWNGFYTRKSQFSCNFWNPQFLLLLLLNLRIIICKRPVRHFDNQEKDMKSAFLRLNEIKYVLIKRIKFQWKKG